MRKRRVVGKIYRMKYSRRGNKDRNIHKTEWKEVGKLGWFMSKTYTATPPSREDEPVGTKTISGCDLDNMTYHQTTSFRLIYQCRSTTVCDGDEDDGRFLADEDLGRWGSLHAFSLAAVEFDSWCADPTALWTGQGLGWGRQFTFPHCIFCTRRNVGENIQRVCRWVNRRGGYGRVFGWQRSFYETTHHKNMSDNTLK